MPQIYPPLIPFSVKPNTNQLKNILYFLENFRPIFVNTKKTSTPLYFHFSQAFRCLFRGGRIYVEAGSPFEAIHPGVTGHYLYMPMIILIQSLPGFSSAGGAVGSV